MDCSDQPDQGLAPCRQDWQSRVIDFLESAVFLADQEGRLQMVNACFLRIFGKESLDDIRGQRLVDMIFPDASRGQKFMRELMAEEVIRNALVRVTGHRVKELSLVVSVRVIRNDDGRCVGLEGSLQDVTAFTGLQEEILQEKLKLEQLLSFDEQISVVRPLGELLDFIVKKTGQILQADKCSLMLYDPQENRLSVQSALGLEKNLMEQARVAMGESVAGTVAQQKTSLWVKDITQDTRFARHSRPRYQNPSFMSASICREDKLIGVINVSDKNLHGHESFSESDFKVLKAIARQAGVSIVNARLYGELEQLSKKDPLTDLHNYRSFTSGLEQEMARIDRYPGPLSLLMIDIDNFKRFNDTFGHIEGDRLLITVGEILRSNLRSVDMICRYGGDEFAVILPRTEIAQAMIVADKLRSRMEEFGWKDKVTISVGAADYQPGMTRFDLVSRADQALYRAKNAGRNQVAL